MMIKSAKMKAITPPKLMPPFHNTAARGTLPTEQTKLSKEITGPISGPQISERTGWLVRKNACQKEAGTQTASAPAISRPSPISVQTEVTSDQKLWLIAVSERPLKSRFRKGPSVIAMSIAAWPSIRPRKPRAACSRASSTSCGRRVHRKSSARIRIMSTPPANSAPRNGQPSRISRISPSSKTRLVEANSKTMAAGKLAPLRKSERAIATAAYEQDDDAAPRSVAIPRLRGESDPRVRATALRETRVCTMADRRNPSASGQRTSQSMSKAEASALTTAWMITMAAYRLALRLVTKRRGPAFLDVLAPVDQKGARPGDDESGDDDAADDAEIEVLEGIPDGASKIQRNRHDLCHLDKTDKECDEHRQCGHRQVVKNLPHRVRECPRVGPGHERAIRRVHQRHRGGEDQR